MQVFAGRGAGTGSGHGKGHGGRRRPSGAFVDDDLVSGPPLAWKDAFLSLSGNAEYVLGAAGYPTAANRGLRRRPRRLALPSACVTT